MIKITRLVLLFLCIGIAIPIQAQDAKKKDDKKEEKKKDPFKAIKEVVKSCHKKEGLFNLYQDTINGKVYMELTDAHLGKEFIHFFHTENGSANAGWVKGSYGWETIFKIRRYFDRVEFVGQNPNFYFDPNNPLSRSANANITEPVIAVEKIVGASKKLDTMLIAAEGLFLNETFPQLTFGSPPGQGPKNPFKKGKLSKSKTRFHELKNYPANTDIIVDLVYQNSVPTNYGLPTVTDARYNSIQLQHSFVAMPDNDYKPRYDDPRVGYFLTQVDDQTSESITPYRDMIHRWHLKKKNPDVALSEPVEPITFWMENTTPTKLRPIIKEAVERWNIAFEKAGFKNAVVVKQQPDDADWDAGDLRYNVLRWTSAPYMGSAWGPSFVNPRTGQILGADIMLDYVFVRGMSFTDKLYNNTAKTLDELIYEEEEELAVPAKHRNHHFCEANHFAVEKIHFGKQVGKAFNFSEEETEIMINETIIELLLHEVGHTLGLSHNFRSSQIWNNDQVHDKALTEKEGLTGSVMDYNPLNLTADRSKQGNYQSVVPGPYDKWAIQHSYTPALKDPMAEKKRVDELLSRSTDPMLTFGNDADAHRSPSMGIDPTINTWDMSSDAIGYALDRIQLCKETMNKIQDKLVIEGKSYEELRSGYYSLLWNYYLSLNTTVRYIGGVKIDRSLVGQDATAKPFAPVSKAEQKRAMKVIVDHGFSPSAFAAPSSIYSYLQKQRRGWDHWGSNEDPKILERVGSFQRSLLSHILHPTVQKRMSNARYYGNGYSVAEMLSDATDGIFKGDLKGSVSPARQNLQITYVEGLISGLAKGSHNNISKSAMLYELKQIQKMMKSNKGKQLETKAHREHVAYLIEKALDD